MAKIEAKPKHKITKDSNVKNRQPRQLRKTNDNAKIRNVNEQSTNYTILEENEFDRFCLESEAPKTLLRENLLPKHRTKETISFVSVRSNQLPKNGKVLRYNTKS